MLTLYCTIAINIAIQTLNPQTREMKNQLTNRMPEDPCSCEVAGGSLWTGEVFGLFVLRKEVIHGSHCKRKNQKFR